MQAYSSASISVSEICFPVTASIVTHIKMGCLYEQEGMSRGFKHVESHLLRNSSYA